MEFFKFKIDNTNEDTNADIITNHCGCNIDEYTFILKGNQNFFPKKTSITFEIPYIDSFIVWNPGFKSSKTLSPDWSPVINASRSAMDAPIQALVSNNDENRLTVAVSDPQIPINIKFGIMEENANVKCTVEFFTMPVSERSMYQAVIRIDTRKIPFYESITDVRKWWGSSGKYNNAFVPNEARMPMYSTWYSFHQNINPEQIIHQCSLAYEMGCRAVIVDDGWQTDDSERGYAYCGDWEVGKSKVKDMHTFVEGVHKTGMKFILWYSVPFIGRNSKAWDKFRDKLIDYDEEKSFCRLDPRFKEVRDYLIEIYAKAAEEWNLDGFKLDFIDRFNLLDSNVPLHDDRRDYESMEEATEELLKKVTEKLLDIKPDMCIEFRQGYTGPLMQTYGNMLRVGDCPIAAMNNRVGSVNIRLLSGKTAVHSDMIMWNKNDTPESAALQIINSLYSVPQISVLLDEISCKQSDMLKFYLDFWNENKDILLDGVLCPQGLDANYSLIYSEKDNNVIAVAYSNPVLQANNSMKKIVFINGMGKEKLYISGISGTYAYKIYDCMGNEKVCTEKELNGLISEHCVPKSGMLVLSKK